MTTTARPPLWTWRTFLAIAATTAAGMAFTPLPLWAEFPATVGFAVGACFVASRFDMQAWHESRIVELTGLLERIDAAAVRMEKARVALDEARDRMSAVMGLAATKKAEA